MKILVSQRIQKIVDVSGSSKVKEIIVVLKACGCVVVEVAHGSHCCFAKSFMHRLIV